jgi:hypothetical protein
VHNRSEDMADTDILVYSFTSLSAAFLTASMSRNSHSTFLWTPPTPNFIQNERKSINCGGKSHLRPYVKNGFHGTKFHGPRCSTARGGGSPISDLNRLLEKMWQIRHKVKHDCQ